MEDKFIENLLNSFPTLKEKYEKSIWNYRKTISSPNKTIIFDFEEEESPQYEEASFCGKLMTLAHISVDLIKDEATDYNDLKEIFLAIERILEQDNQSDIQNSFEICFFETILNALSHTETRYIHLFSDLLRPISRKLCVNNENFWGTNLLDS